jgi:hypothetical protein
MTDLSQAIQRARETLQKCADDHKRAPSEMTTHNLARAKQRLANLERLR